VTTFNNQQHINVIAGGYHVDELYYDGAWHLNDLTALTGAPPVGPIIEYAYFPIAGYQTSFNYQQHVIFSSSDNHVHELIYDNAWNPDNAWHHNDLTNLAGAPNAVGATRLAGYQTSFKNQHHVIFTSADGHIQELYYDSAWHDNDLTLLAGAPTVWADRIVGYETALNNQQHVIVCGYDFHVYEFYNDGAWHYNDLSQLTGAPNVFAGLDGYATTLNNQQHINFVDANGHVYDLYDDGTWPIVIGPPVKTKQPL